MVVSNSGKRASEKGERRRDWIEVLGEREPIGIRREVGTGKRVTVEQGTGHLTYLGEDVGELRRTA